MAVDSMLLRSKALILGSAGVGKSSMTQVFHSELQQFPKAYSMTTGIDLAVRTIKIPDSPYTVEVFLYDCAGQETFTPTVAKVLGGSTLVLLVFDVTDASSLSATAKWFERARNANTDTKIHAVLVGNKTDLEARRVVTQTEGREVAASLGVTYFECSAKDSTGIEAPFYFLASCLHEQFSENTEEFTAVSESM